jgi:predicted TIM-barrel fold metal-dependent hydrolase
MQRVSSSIRATFESGKPFGELRIIDFHAHLMPSDIRNAYMPWSDPEGLLKTMDRLGIEKACISGSFKYGNDGVISAIKAHPKRFVGFCSINTYYPGDVSKELERCYKNGMKGIGELSAFGAADSVANTPWHTIYKFAEEHQCPVLIHSGPVATAKANGPKIIAEVSAQYPSVDFVIGHSGAYDSWELLAEAAQLATQHKNLYLDISSLGRYCGMLEYLVEHAGSGKMVFGTDGPYLCFTADLANVAYSPIRDEDKRKILGENAAKILGI